MKKMMSVFVMLAIVCGVSSSALSESKVAVVRNGEVFKVIYQSSDVANVKVTISDDSGEKVFSEELISTRGFIRPYNFTDMPKGDYTICIADLDGKRTEKICFDDRAVKHAWNARISKVSGGARKIIVTVPPEEVSDFSVNIFDKNDQLVYTEDQKGESGYARIFNLKNLEEGAVVHVVNRMTGEAKSLRTE